MRAVNVLAAVSLDVASVGQHVPSAPLVVEKHVEERSQLRLQGIRLHGGERLDPAHEVARHAIGRTDVVLLVAPVVEVVDPRVLEEPADDADHANVVRKAGNTRTQATRVANDEVDVHARLRGFVEGAGDVDIFERVGLDLNEALLPFADSADLSPDLLEEGGLEDLWCGQQLLVGAARLVPSGQIVEELGRVTANALVAREQSEVGVELGRLLVVVARANVHVAAQAIVVAANHEDELAVRLDPRRHR